MRDTEFSIEFIKEVPKLEKFFRDRMTKPIPRGDKALLAEDLVQLTAMCALENSRKPEYAHYSIKALLIEKAKNVLYDYTNPPKKRFVSEALTVLAEERNGLNSELDRLVMAQEIEYIRSSTDRKTWEIVRHQNKGYSYPEIADQLNLNQENLRQRISRLREKIKLRWKEKGLL